jgi:hypothetical protein
MSLFESGIPHRRALTKRSPKNILSPRAAHDGLGFEPSGGSDALLSSDFLSRISANWRAGELRPGHIACPKFQTNLVEAPPRRVYRESTGKSHNLRPWRGALYVAALEEKRKRSRRGDMHSKRQTGTGRDILLPPRKSTLRAVERTTCLGRIPTATARRALQLGKSLFFLNRYFAKRYHVFVSFYHDILLIF